MSESKEYPPILLVLERRGANWYGLAMATSEEALVATSTGRAMDEALHYLEISLPKGAPYAFAKESEPRYEATIDLLASLEAGADILPEYALSKAWISEERARVFKLVSAIPRGYACSYGRIAAAAGVIAREVGSLMAHNPLYPLVPCHRVVGSDYSLVGYRGATEGPDLDDKLERLCAEARGFKDEPRVGGADGILVFPVERVIARVAGRDRGEAGQLSLW